MPGLQLTSGNPCAYLLGKIPLLLAYPRPSRVSPVYSNAMELELAQWALLLGGAAVAGWIDAVIGGGGLVLIPLIVAVLPQLAPVSGLAGNKVAAGTGKASAAVNRIRNASSTIKLIGNSVTSLMVHTMWGTLLAVD